MKVYQYVAEIIYEDDGWEILTYPSKAEDGKMLNSDRECLLDFLKSAGYDTARLEMFNTKQLEQICLSCGVYVQLVD